MFKRGGTPNTGIMDGFGEDRVMASNGKRITGTNLMVSGGDMDDEKADVFFAPGSSQIMGTTPTATEPVFTPGEAPDEPLFGLSDYASLFKLGANIASAPGRGTGLGGVFAAAGPSLALAADEFAASQEAKAARRREFEATEQGRKDAFDAAKREEQFRENLLDKEIEGKLQIADKDILEKEFILSKADELRQILLSGTPEARQAAIDSLDVLFPTKAQAKYDEIEEARNEGYYDYEDDAIAIMKQIQDQSDTSKETERLRKLYAGKTKTSIQKSLAIADVIADYSYGPEKKAEGGRVGLQEGGQAMSMQGGDQSPELSFEELRARLPMEVTDQVVRLLATSEAALLDFANIDTQEDIAIFNQKYNVDLQLPVQVA